MVLLRHVRALGLTAALVAVWAIGGAAPAAADYGNSGGNVQLYQVTASANCNNPDVCVPPLVAELGGFWAWGVFNADGTFDAEITFCGHLDTPAGPFLAGAGHEHVDGTYVVTDFGLGPWIVLTSETDVLTGLGHGAVVTIPSESMPIGPAAKAKLSTSDFFGFSAPGVSFQLTVTPMHT
jgi:hypothetical protein